MKKKQVAVLAVAASLLLVAGPMFAHHSMALYDKEHPITMQGTVTEFRMVNPHVQIHFEVKDENGNLVKWTAGSVNPRQLYRTGWNTKTLQPGDEITVTCNPAKDGRKLCSVLKLVGPNGKVINVENE